MVLHATFSDVYRVPLKINFQTFALRCAYGTEL
jgi:hypothetical protein